MKKRISVLLIISLLTLGLYGCGNNDKESDKADGKAEQSSENDDKPDSDSAAEGITIRLGHQPGHAQPLIAEANGFFEEEFADDGITVELIQFASGPPIIEAFAAGELDFGLTGDQPAIQGRANDLDIKAIASYGSTEEGNALIATKDSGISSLADLEGKKIGYTTGSVGHQLLLKFLADVNLTETDAELINLSPGDIYTSLQSGSVDAAVTWEPYISNSVEEGVAEIIQDGTGYKYNVNVIIGRTEFLEANTDISARLLKVLDKAAKWSDDNIDETITILSESSGVDPSAYTASLNKFTRELFLDDKKIESIKDTAGYLEDQGIIRTAVDVNALIDTSYLEKAGITQ